VAKNNLGNNKNFEVYVDLACKAHVDFSVLILWLPPIDVRILLLQLPRFDVCILVLVVVVIRCVVQHLIRLLGSFLKHY